MKLSLALPTLAVVTALAVPAAVNAQAAAAPPEAASAAATGCPQAAKRHDHGAERNAPSGASTLCQKGGATPPAAKAKSKPNHDHTRMHKTL